MWNPQLWAPFNILSVCLSTPFLQEEWTCGDSPSFCLSFIYLFTIILTGSHQSHGWSLTMTQEIIYHDWSLTIVITYGLEIHIMLENKWYWYSYCVLVLVFHLKTEEKLPSLSCLLQHSVISPPSPFLHVGLGTPLLWVENHQIMKSTTFHGWERS